MPVKQKPSVYVIHLW